MKLMKTKTFKYFNKGIIFLFQDFFLFGAFLIHFGNTICSMPTVLELKIICNNCLRKSFKDYAGKSRAMALVN